MKRPTQPADALAVLAGTPGARYLAGGTNLVDLMKLGIETPGLLVRCHRSPVRRHRRRPGRRATCGRRRAQQRPGREPGSPAPLPGARAGRAGGGIDPASQHGHRRRQPVAEDPLFVLSGRHQALQQAGARVGCPAREGEHHNLAILGRVAALHRHPPVGHGGGPRCARRSRARYRTCRTATGPARPVLPPCPATTPSWRRPSSWRADHRGRAAGVATGGEVTVPQGPERASYAFAIGSVAAALDVADGVVRDVRIALGAVAPLPWRAHRAEQAMRGGPATEQAFRDAADASSLRLNRCATTATRCR